MGGGDDGAGTGGACVRQLRERPGLRERARIIGVAGAAVAALVLAALVVPLPYRTQAEGDLAVRAGDAAPARPGFISALLAAPGATVAAGAPLVRSVDPALNARAVTHRARVAELEATYGKRSSPTAPAPKSYGSAATEREILSACACAPPR